MKQPADTLINDGIHTLKRSIAILPKDRQEEFLKPLGAIERRFWDKDFYIAVIGNYNAGKSTFLNALLRADILSAGDFPTTAIPTYIRWNRSEVLKMRRQLGHIRIPDDDSPCIQVVLEDGTKLFADGFDDYDQQTLQNITGIKLPDEIEARVDLLTTTNSLAGKIKRINLSFPEREEFKNLCIIDTPGIDPGDEANAVHIMNTQSVLREKADCAIILYQAMGAMAGNTKAFIEENAAHLMGNAIVFLTKMDVAKRKEWDKLVKYTEKLLHDNFHQEQPIVCPVSAQKAREYQSGRDASSEGHEWSTSFDGAIKEVISVLYQRRREIVTKHLLDLMRTLTESLQGVIENSRKELEDQAAVLKANSWENVKQEVSAMQRAFQHDIESKQSGYASMITTRTSMKVNAARDAVCSKISEASDSKALQKYSSDYYESSMTQAQNSAWQEIRSIIINDIEDAQKKFRAKIEECLREHGRYLGGIDVIREGSSLSVMSTSSASVHGLSKESSFIDNHGGKMIVLILFGPLGGLVGWFIDSTRFNSKKTEAKDAVCKGSEKFQQALSRDFTSQIDSYISGVCDWSKSFLDSYRDRYKALYAQAEEAYNHHKADNDHELGRCRIALEDLGKLRLTVTEGSN